MTTKVQRQATISRLIGDHEVTNQPQLIALLADQGIEATQATVSRDLDQFLNHAVAHCVQACPGPSARAVSCVWGMSST